ncbi:MAG: response regulator [Candidatus Auribacterota bacterium]
MTDKKLSYDSSIPEDINAVLDLKEIEWSLIQLLIELIPGFLHDLNNVMGIVSNYRDLYTSARTGFANTQNSLKVFDSILKSATNTKHFLTLFQGEQSVHVQNIGQYLDRITKLFYYKFKEKRITAELNCTFPYSLILPEIFTNYLMVSILFYLSEISAGKSEIMIETRRQNNHLNLTFTRTSWNSAIKSLNHSTSPFITMLERHINQCNCWLERLKLKPLSIVTERSNVKAQNYIITLELPVQLFEECSLEAPEEIGLEQKIPPTRLTTTTQRILIIDDEKIMCDLLMSIFEDSKYLLDYATDSTEAIDKCRETRYDLIICDYMLPGTTAPEIIKNIIAISGDTKFIIITGCADASLEERLLKPPVFYVLRKPFKIDEIINSVQKLMQ